MTTHVGGCRNTSHFWNSTIENFCICCIFLQCPEAFCQYSRHPQPPRGKKSNHLAPGNQNKLNRYNSCSQNEPCVSGLSTRHKKDEKYQEYEPSVSIHISHSGKQGTSQIPSPTLPPPWFHPPFILPGLLNNILK